MEENRLVDYLHSNNFQSVFLRTERSLPYQYRTYSWNDRQFERRNNHIYTNTAQISMSPSNSHNSFLSYHILFFSSILLCPVMLHARSLSVPHRVDTFGWVYGIVDIFDVSSNSVGPVVYEWAIATSSLNPNFDIISCVCIRYKKGE